MGPHGRGRGRRSNVAAAAPGRSAARRWGPGPGSALRQGGRPRGQRPEPAGAGAEGALDRCEAVRRAAAMEEPLAYFEKTRTTEGVRHSVLRGETGPQAVIVDDILDTGGTLVSSCEGLQRAGVAEIIVMVTHGLFTGSLWQRLWSLGVTRIYCTDTVPLPPGVASTGVAVLSVAPLLREYLALRGAG